MSQAMDDIKNRLKAHQAEKETLYKEARTAILDAFKEQVFEKYPTVKNIGWPQYTPYFNDGDPCTFSASTYSDDIYVNGIGGYDSDDDENEEDTFSEVRRVVANILQSVPEEVLEGWDEGLIVINQKLKVKCEDYDHD